MRHHFLKACKILDKVFADRTYVDRAFDGEDASDMTARIVYGVLEENVKCGYIISELTDKPPQKQVYILLKEGVYALLNLDNVPAYAIVSECVEAVRMLGKPTLAGFVNAVLKKVAAGKFRLPEKGSADYLSLHYSKPQWFVDRMVAEYGEEKTVAMLDEPTSDCVHIRVNHVVSADETVCGILDEHGEKYEKTEAGGYVVKVTPTVKSLFAQGVVTYQSPSSMLAVSALAPKNGSKILDVCAAPGGKSVYAAQMCPDSEVVACDLHAHRVELIRKYAARMRTPNVRTVKCDATVFEPAFADAFDFVLVDAPCTCFGTYRKHPDVFLQRGDEDIAKLAETQRRILTNTAKYLKKSGVMVYSTCTLFGEENDFNADFAERELGLKPEIIPFPFPNDGRYRILPHGEWDGFFIARLVKP